MKLFYLTILFVFCSFWALSQTPSNDECVAASEFIIDSGPITLSNLNTAIDGPDPTCGGLGIHDVWFYFVYAQGNITIQTTLGTLTDTRLALYATCGGDVVACNDDNGNYSSILNLGCSSLQAGNTYYVQVGGYNALQGEFVLNITSTPVVGCTNPIASNYDVCATVDNGGCIINGFITNDECTGAFPLTIGGPAITADNTMATSNGSNPSCGNQGANLMLDVWFSFVHDGTELDVNVNAGSLTDTRLAVYNNCGGAQIACDDDSGPGNASYIHFDCGDLLAGLTYYIRAGGYGALTGTFSVSVTSTNTCVLGESCDVPYTAQVGENISPAPNGWFAFIPPQNGQWRISTCNLNACDTKIWIYDYCQMANFDDSNEATFTYNDDFCGLQAEITPVLAGGQEYYLRVGDTEMACGDSPITFLIEYMGPVIGCLDILACNYSAIAELEGPCYYNDDPECDGIGPDLAVLLQPLYSSLYATTINSTDACLVNEGCLQGLGVRQILRFTTHIKNIGNQDYFIGVPSADNDQFEWDQCHNHYHYEGYAEYLLFDGEGNPMPQIGFKNGFCVLDLECSDGGIAKFGCGNMGITAGCGDIYSSGLSCQWIDVTDVPDGDYYLVVRTNWDQSPDNAGHYEQQYDNNWAQVCIHFERDVNGNIINFTKDINSCMPVLDCIGQPFGNTYPDCAGNCPGVLVRGDVVSDSALNELDVNDYVLSTIDGNIPFTFCSDLNNDGIISVADAVLLEACIHGQEELGIPAEDMIDCPYDDELINTSQTTELGISEVNTTEGYVDVYILNPDNEVKGIEFEISGILINDVEALSTLDNWDMIMEFSTGGVHISAVGHEPTYMDKFSVPTAIFRVYYDAITESEICISNIIDIVNLDNHNTNTVIGECIPVQLDFALFTVESNTVCAGNTLQFTDTSLREITTWQWTFEAGNPGISSDENPLVLYSVPGVYSVSLTVSDGILTDSYQEEFYVSVMAPTSYFVDNDLDGYGDDSQPIESCTMDLFMAEVGGDCDDANVLVYPGAPGTGEGIDNNCNLSIDPGEVGDCICDLTGDGMVDVNDLMAVINEFGCLVGCSSDLDNDGAVTTSDVAIFMGCYQVNCQ